MVHDQLLTFLLDETDRFIGLYDVSLARFIQVNKGGLKMFDAADLQHFDLLRRAWFSEARVAALLPVLRQQKKWQEETLLATHQGQPFWVRLEVDLWEKAADKDLLAVRIANIDRYKSVERQDGTHFPVEVSLSYFYEEQNMFVVAFIQDITFKVEATQQLLAQQAAFQQLNTNLETQVISRTQALVETLQDLEQPKSELEKALTKEKELSELKSRFVSMASHEFRTPLSVIQSSSDLLRRYIRAEGQPNAEKHLRHPVLGRLPDRYPGGISVGRQTGGRPHQGRFYRTQLARTAGRSHDGPAGKSQARAAVCLQP
jgi:signal transduction histidine kinase